MLETAFTRIVGCTVPIQLAGIGAIASPELVAAVCEAGGLGQLTIAGISMEDTAARIDRVERVTSRPFGINLVFPYLDLALVRMAASRAPFVDFHWGDPDPDLVDVVHAAGGRISWQVGSVGEAVMAERAGCDFIIAQGTWAGGHLRGRVSLLPLLSGVLNAVSLGDRGRGDDARRAARRGRGLGRAVAQRLCSPGR